MTDPKPSPAWQGLRPTGKTLDNGQPEPGRPIIINCQQTNPENCHESHNKPHNSADCPGLCTACTGDFRAVLADVPLLLDDLDIAIAGETRFVEHGTRNGTTDSKASGRHPAIAAQQRLTQALIGDGTQAHPGVKDWFDNYGPSSLARQLLRNLHRVQHEPRMPNLARDITQAASRAHKVIDMPVDLCYFGPCPDCGRDIVQERIHTIVDENGVRTVDPDAPPVVCRFTTCGYAAPLDVHQRKLLEAGEDRWLTVGELVSAITSGGEVVTRAQINGWIERGGLAREKRVRPRYVNGELKTEEVWTYRLGDVRDRAARGDQRRKANA